MAIDFDGSEFIRTATLFEELEVGTLSFFVTMNSVSFKQRLMGSTNHWEMVYDFGLNSINSDIRESSSFVFFTPVVAGVRYHVLNTFSNTLKEMYRDGVLTDSNGLTPLPTRNTDRFAIGRAEYRTNEYATGIFEDVRIYNRVLSEKEVQAVYNRDRILDGLLYWWPLINGVESEVVSFEPDLVTKKNITLVTGSPVYAKSPLAP